MNSKRNEYVKKLIINIFIIAIIIVSTIGIMPNFVFAEFDPNAWDIQSSADPYELVNNDYAGLVGTLQTIGYSVAVIALIILGIKYMVGSVDEKAEYKERMIPYVIGILFVFSITSVIGMITNVTSRLTGSGGVTDATAVAEDIVLGIGRIVAGIMVIVLGIKYVSGSLEEKAEYKRSLIPYLIGAVFVFASTLIVGMLRDYTSDISSSGDIENAGWAIRDIVLQIASIFSIIAIIIIGIKYMIGSTDEKASYKKSMLPYFVGCIFIFAATNIVSYIENTSTSSGASIDSIGGSIISLVTTIGSIASVATLAGIGIKYMVGSIEEKATYKSTLLPYAIGSVLVFAGSTIAGYISDITSGFTADLSATGNSIITIITTIGSIASVAVLLIIGIRYMAGSVDEKATYKRTFMPYVIGAGLVFAASSIASIIYNAVT